MKKIDDLYGDAYKTALENVANMLRYAGVSLTYRDDWDKLERICSKLNVRFDENGEIV